MTWAAGPLCAALAARAGPRSSPRAFARLRRRLRAARPRVRAPGRDRVLAVRACRARVCRSARYSRSRRGSSARRLRRKRVARRRHGSARARGPKPDSYRARRRRSTRRRVEEAPLVVVRVERYGRRLSRTEFVASRTIFTASSARWSALGAMLGAPPAAETGPHPRLAPHEFKLFLGLSPDYQILYFRSQLRDDAVDSDKYSWILS